MAQQPLGRFKRVDDLRSVWPDEAHNFTPWLAQPENIELIAEAIGETRLEVESVEKSVGPFRADILCRDSKDRYVLIENQLERTDHGHMGQLMTYAAGLDTVTVVWVARKVTDEHRAALDWLNKITADDFGFFGLEIELWQIGDSLVAPKFNVVSKPNNFTEAVRTNAAAGSDGLTETQQLHFDYWTQFKQFMEERSSPVRVGKPSKDSWISIATGRAFFTIYAINAMRAGGSRIYLSMTGPQAKANFAQMKSKFENEIATSLGTVDWRELPDAKESQIEVRNNLNPSNRLNWPELNDWFARTLENWFKVLPPLIRQVNAPIVPQFAPEDALPSEVEE